MNMAETPDRIEPSEWRDRCALRIAEIEPDLATAETRALAQELHAFERTRVMAPEAAADFVASEMGREERTRFERRGPARRNGSGSAPVQPD